jgi:hypothetical protein
VGTIEEAARLRFGALVGQVLPADQVVGIGPFDRAIRRCPRRDAAGEPFDRARTGALVEPARSGVGRVAPGGLGP